jgi:hypothetical protein
VAYHQRSLAASKLEALSPACGAAAVSGSESVLLPNNDDADSVGLPTLEVDPVPGCEVVGRQRLSPITSDLGDHLGAAAAQLSSKASSINGTSARRPSRRPRPLPNVKAENAEGFTGARLPGKLHVLLARIVARKPPMGRVK